MPFCSARAVASRTASAPPFRASRRRRLAPVPAPAFRRGATGTVPNHGAGTEVTYGVGFAAEGLVPDAGMITVREDLVIVQGAIRTIAELESVVATVDDGAALFAEAV